MKEPLLDSILEDVDDAAEQHTLRQAWIRLGQLEPTEPPTELARRFAQTIEMVGVTKPASAPFRRRLAPLAAVLVLGIAIGSLAVRIALVPRGDGAVVETSLAEPGRLSRALSVVFQSHPLASRRLEAVETLAGLPQDPEIGRILTEVVNTDPSVGVRLVAIDAIRPYVADEEVARRLIRTARGTDSPLLRIRLIELFVDHRIAAALPEIEAFHRDPRVDELVREAAQWATGRL